MGDCDQGSWCEWYWEVLGKTVFSDSLKEFRQVQTDTKEIQTVYP